MGDAGEGLVDAESRLAERMSPDNRGGNRYHRINAGGEARQNPGDEKHPDRQKGAVRQLRGNGGKVHDLEITPEALEPTRP